MPRIGRMLALTGLILATAGARVRVCAADEPAAFTAEQVRFFEQRVRPVLEQNCFKCHGDDLTKLRGDLYLKSRAGILRGSHGRPVVDVKEPAKSVLLQMVSYIDPEKQMPPTGKMADEDIATIREWVMMGAPWSPDSADAIPQAIIDHDRRGGISDEDRSHWAYQKVQRPAVPQVRDRAWVSNAIDAFILAKLEAASLKPNGPATKAELIRRVYYDLIGLPPTPDEVERFVSDASPDAYSTVVEELLASPHYGEKWGRHWLDLVRYAETNAYERDGPKPNVWRYRDYVIRSFNDDKPYDRFIREQIAGDELDEVTPETITATGYYRLGLWDDEPADPKQAYFDGLDDIVSTTSGAFLAMSVGCARCHDHKIDPIPQKDYYRLMAFFSNVRPFSHDRGVNSPFSQTTIANGEEIQRWEKVRRDRVAQIEQELRPLEEKVHATLSGPEQDDAKAPQVRRLLIDKYARKVLSDAEYASYKRLHVEMDNLPVPPPASALSVTEHGREAKPTHLLIRGSAHAEGDPVTPGYPRVLGVDDPTFEPRPGDAKSSGRRRVLADWIASPENPLTARVMVNRVWQHHFGRGIARSSNEFGKLGEKPTHPELLDWLAAEFVERGWSIKQMHRLILASSAYRMSSADQAAGIEKDPGNDLLWRFDMRRLTAEEIRDSMLAINGTLNLQMYGPSVFTPVPAEVLATASRPDAAWGKSPPDQQVRRSIYVHVKRSLIEPFLGSFDLADTDASCPVRFATTVPTQALTMLNSATTHGYAAAFARRLRAEAGSEPAAQVRLALRLVTQRDVTDAEVARGVALIDALKQHEGQSDEQALNSFCLLALNLNEFVYLR